MAWYGFDCIRLAPLTRPRKRVSSISIPAVLPFGPEGFAMPKGKHNVRQRSNRTRQRHRTERWRRDDWVRYASTAAQVASAIAALIEAIRH